MIKRRKPLIVVGIDVGGRRKGFHAVALRDGRYLGKCPSCDLTNVVAWCRKLQARVIAIDAPCHWSKDGRSRPAERDLMGEGIWCFSTPTRERALNHHTNHYGWMLRGEELFRTVETTHSLCGRLPFPARRRHCFETFPHAITCNLGGRIFSAKNKRKDREALLRTAGIDMTEISNLDLVDAALCALTAHHAGMAKPCKSYGEPVTGCIIVPKPGS